MSFRDQLKACREACGLTRAALAEQLGVSASAVGNYETGVSFPKAVSYTHLRIYVGVM